MEGGIIINNTGLRLFISYSHEDEEPYIEEFKKHITPMIREGIIKEWYDRYIPPGVDFEKEIEKNLISSDIFCLLISANYLSSSSCQSEKNKALQLKMSRNCLVIPIIIEHCGWKDDKEITSLLALPKDGKPISSFKHRDEAWYNIYNNLKKIIIREIRIREMQLSSETESFLKSAEMITRSHPHKQDIILDDIFVYPQVRIYDKNQEAKKSVSFEKILMSCSDYPKIVIAGEDLSGKTTLCKIIYKKYREMNFVPIYVNDRQNEYKGNIENKILESFKKQYNCPDINIDEISDRIIPIIDDFHQAKYKEKHIERLSKYQRCVLIVDDIFSLNIKDKKLVSSYYYLEIMDFKPSLRYSLIKKWISLSDKRGKNIYQDIDHTIESIDSFLGRTIGKGIISAYPFFILSAIIAQEIYIPTIEEGEITSQGYCYYALIYFYLKKQGVRGNEIDTYINFLTELAFYFFKMNKYEISSEEFKSFLELYLENYNLPVKYDILLRNLEQIVSIDSFGNYSFKYPYFYYFFVAKYLAENMDNLEIKKRINILINNLHIEENAYIVVFLAHHSKKEIILDEILVNAMCLFDKYNIASLGKKEMGIFNSRAELIIEAVLPPADIIPEQERKELMDCRDREEEIHDNCITNEDIDNIFGQELRRAIKTVEVMGLIIKNRAGSMEKKKLKEIFEEGMHVHLRILSSFLEIIYKEENEDCIVEYISDRVKEIESERKISNSERKLSNNEIRKFSRIIFWNINFLVVYGVIYKIVHSLGSENLIEIIEDVCDKENTIASTVVKHGILMWYNKNLQIEEIVKVLRRDDMSIIPDRVIRLMISEFCRFHPIPYKDRQKLERKLGYSSKGLLENRYVETF